MQKAKESGLWTLDCGFIEEQNQTFYLKIKNPLNIWSVGGGSLHSRF
jgi:hypothetical protein